MAAKLGDAYIAITGREEGLDRAFNSARVRVRGFLRDITTGIAQGIGQALAQGIGRAVQAGLGEIGKAVDAADKLNQAIIRTNKVFGDSAADIRAWGQTAATSLGISEEAALANASALGNMLTQLGVSRQEAAVMSKQMVETATDLAAFHGVAGGAATVLDTMAAAFRGEYDALQRFLPAITDAAIKHQALAETGKKNEGQLTTLDKALATQTLLLEGAAGAAGSFADSIERGTGAQEIFAARMEDARADLGQVGTIIQREVFQALNELLDEMGFYGENIVEQLVVGLTQGLRAITPFLGQLRQVFVNILKPGSPPKLLPELNEWGKAAMQEYLKGWTLADFDALKSVGGIIEDVVRSFAASGDIKETDLVATVFGTQRTITQAIRDFRNLGRVTESTLGSIADAAGPAGAEIAGLVREYFQLQQASQKAADAQADLARITDRYSRALDPLNDQLDAVRGKQQEIRENQRLEAIGEILRDPRAEADEKQLARLEAEEIQLERQARAIEGERDTAVDAAQAKIDAAKAEEDAQRSKFEAAQSALDQQTRTNALIEEEVTLRERLANDAIAAQERALRELEAQQRELEAAERKRLSELEQIADAQLRYQLATTDTAGQLEIMRAELAKVAVGSAEYFDILTDIFQLEQRLADGRSKDTDPIKNLEEIGKVANEQKQYLTDFGIALDAALGAGLGTDGKEWELTPFWEGVEETIRNIGTVATETGTLIGNLIAFFTGQGGDENSTSDILRPTHQGGIFGQLYTLVTTTITNLRLISQGEWRTVWAGFREVAQEELQKDLLEGDEKGAWFWEQITEIGDLITALGEGDWKTAWEIFTEPPRELIQSIIDKITELLNLEERIQSFMEKFGFPTNPFEDNPRINPNKIPQSEGQDVLPGSPFASFNDISPQGLAFASASGNVTGDTIVFAIEQNIATNGDFGGAYAGALEGIRQALVARTLQGNT